MRLLISLLTSTLVFVGCSPTETSPMSETEFSRLQKLEIAAPAASKVPFEETHHARTLSDHYHWLKDQGYPTVDDKPIIDYLEQENAYYQDFLKPNSGLVEKIFQEFKGRTDEEETVYFKWL